MVSRFLERKDEWVALCEKLLHDGKPEPSPIDLRALAQHTSDRRRSSDIFDVVEKCLEPTPNAKLLAKAIATVRYLVINGAEHVVDRAWRLKDAVGALERYNSATCGKYGFQRGGRDEGGDVRRRAAELASVLGDVDRIRSLRAEAATHAHRDGPDLRHGQGGAQIVIGAGHSLAEIPGYVAGDDAVALAAQAAAPSARHGFGAGDAPPPAPAASGLVDLLDFDAAPVEAPQAMPDGGLLPTDEQQAVQRQLAQQRGELEQLKQQLAMQQTIAAQQQQLFQLQQRQGGGGALGGGGAMGAPGGGMNGAMGVPTGAMGAFPPAQQQFPPAQQPQFAQQQQRQPLPPQPGFAPPPQQQQRPPPQMQQPGFMPQQMPQPGMQQMRQPGMQQMQQQRMPQPGMQQMQQPGMPQPGMQQMPQPGFPQQMQQHPPPPQQQYPPQQQQFPF